MKIFYLLLSLFFVELLFSNCSHACSICVWQISEYYFPPINYFIVISLLWSILQISIDNYFKIRHIFYLNFITLFIFLLVTILISGMALGPFAFIWLFLYPLVIFVSVACFNKYSVFNKYRKITIVVALCFSLIYLTSFFGKYLERSHFTKEQLLQKYKGTAVEKLLTGNISIVDH